MSPTRTRGKPVYRHRTRSRREVVTAVAGAAGVVIGTILMIWLLRPGSLTPGTGGLLSRQPRAAWLVGLTLGALILFTVWAFRRQQRWQGRFIVVLISGWLILLLGAVLAGILWPGGLLRQYETAPVPEIDPSLLTTTVPDLASTTVPPGTETTVPAGTDTTAPAATTPTTAPGSP